jgi:hypothetical protein
LEKARKISPTPGFDPRSVQPVASRYIDWAIPVHRNAGSTDRKFPPPFRKVWFSLRRFSPTYKSLNRVLLTLRNCMQIWRGEKRMLKIQGKFHLWPLNQVRLFNIPIFTKLTIAQRLIWRSSVPNFTYIDQEICKLQVEKSRKLENNR